MQQKLNAEDIRKVCDPAIFDNLPRQEETASKIIIGQQRAVKALKLGLSMKAHGFNIYVSGAPGTGKQTAVTNYIEQQAMSEPAPCDWCYVNNFKDTYRPDKLSMPAGHASQFKKEMKGLVLDMYNALVKAFESDDYATKKEKIINSFEELQAGILGKVGEEAEKESFTIKQTQTSFITIPLKNNKPVTEEELRAMPESELDEINRKQSKLQEDIGAALREIRKAEKLTNEQLDKLAREIAAYAIGSLIEELAEKYKAEPGVTKYLVSLREDIMDNLPEFMKSQKMNAQGNAENPFVKRYEVNVLVDNSETQGAPVVPERNPTYINLVGRVEKESYMGALVTDFTMIRKGALHSANGGYLILRADDLLRNYFAWDSLKRALKNKEIVIEDATEQMGYLTSRSLKPEAVPLNVKVFLTGSPYIYQMLYEYDPDFRELFKIKADFDSQMERTDENARDYGTFLQALCSREQLPRAGNTAMAKIIEYSSRLADDQAKLSTSFDKISDVIREAAFYAAEDGAAEIEGAHVMKAIEEKLYRSNLLQEKLNEMITSHQIYIDTDEEKTGQINGLSVLDIGDMSFGIPARITCSVSLGRSGVIAIEREAEMSGPIHTKGVLILSGYLSSKFMQDKPVSLSARLVFEQSYSGVEGDSASSTELYAILSALANLPIRQGIAVTGSVNQKGEVQPIGGVNEKIEGYFAICKRIGLNGKQGVMVPGANVRNMMLKEEIAGAVRDGHFNIWAVDSIDEGIEILTGVKAGSIWEEGTVYYMVDSMLKIYAERMRVFGGGEEGSAPEME